MKLQLFGAAVCIAAANARTHAPVTLAQVDSMIETQDIFDDIGNAFEDLGDWTVQAGEDAINWTDQAF